MIRLEDSQEAVLRDGDEVVLAEDGIKFGFSDPNQTIRVAAPPNRIEKPDVRVEGRINIDVASKEVTITGKRGEAFSRKACYILL